MHQPARRRYFPSFLRTNCSFATSGAKCESSDKPCSIKAAASSKRFARQCSTAQLFNPAARFIRASSSWASRTKLVRSSSGFFDLQTGRPYNPVVTLNVSEKFQGYQTDTGPVLFPDLAQPHTQPLDMFWLAFCAFNSPDWTEFIVQQPTPVGAGISVNHYSESRWVEGRNSLIALP